MYYFVLAIFLFGLFAIWRIVNSPFGMILQARSARTSTAPSRSAIRVAALQARRLRHVGGAGGAGRRVKALVFQFATLTDVAWQMSGEVILMTLLGGIGTLLGPIFGAGLVVALQNTSPPRPSR